MAMFRQFILINNDDQDQLICNNVFPHPVNCTWTAWGSFGQCSKTCGGGYKVRTRFVDQEEMYNGTCLEPASDIENCNSQLCEGIK